MHILFRICERILDILFPPRETELLIRHAETCALHVLYRPRIYKLKRSFVTSLLPYHHPLVQACVIEAKFHANRKARRLLGAVLEIHLERIHRLSRPLKLEPTFIPIPLGKKRLKERGYNQVEEIARTAPIRLVTQILQRIRETVPQTTLDGKERRKNVRDAFGVADEPDPAYLYIVLDDVLTTGSTLTAAGRVLAEAGARPISLLALAH